MLRCPQCGSTWPEGNFCPHDGAALVAIAPAAPEPDVNATRLETPALQIDSGPLNKPTKPARPVADADMPATIIDMRALDEDAMRQGRQKAVTKTEHPPEDERPRVALKAQDTGRVKMSDEKKTEAQNKPTEQDAKAADSKGPKRPAKDQSFSETQWFMTGAMTDADLLEMVEQSSYDRDEKITEKDREGFTLRETDDKD